MEPVVTIACVRAGTKYPARYVEILFDMVSRTMPEETPFRQVCFTDQPETYERAVTHPLPPELSGRGWWNKLYLFSPDAFKPGERILFFDLDTLLIGMLTDIVGYSGDFAALRDVYRPDGLQSSVMMWEAGKFGFIWELWKAAGMPDIPGGDQIWIEHALKAKRYKDTGKEGLEFDRLQDVFPGKFVSFKVDCLNGPPADASVVFFHGDIKPHEFESGWVRDFWQVGGLAPADLELACNTDDGQIADNVKSALARGLPELPYSVQPHDGTVCIVGGGPSARGHIEELKLRRLNGHQIWALNGAAAWLTEHGIVPDGHWLLDARPENIGFLNSKDRQTRYYVASQCDASLFNALADYDVTIYHAEGNRQHVPPDTTLVGGGSTVGLKALAGAYMEGFTNIHLYGFDSSYRDEDHHAYPQALNDGETILTPQIGDRKFRAAAWMVNQAQEFQNAVASLADLDVDVFVHGDGLLPHIVRHLEVPVSAASKRAKAVLSRLLDKEGEVRGAEVGVFTGAMSERLLRWHPGLFLYMVDSWEGDGAAYQDRTDHHIGYTQEQQDAFAFYAGKCTSFAPERREIIHKRSVEAAADVPDASLDFVFLDADHSYESVRADIAAWLPKLRPGGVMCGHDYDHPEFPEWGVKQAADEFAGAHGLALETGDNFTWFVKLPDTAQEVAA